ncbi:hypothetical protein CALCODRAFT_545579, partial [Calocera cornea HHB12733]
MDTNRRKAVKQPRNPVKEPKQLGRRYPRIKKWLSPPVSAAQDAYDRAESPSLVLPPISQFGEARFPSDLRMGLPPIRRPEMSSEDDGDDRVIKPPSSSTSSVPPTSTFGRALLRPHPTPPRKSAGRAQVAVTIPSSQSVKHSDLSRPSSSSTPEFSVLSPPATPPLPPRPEPPPNGPYDPSYRRRLERWYKRVEAQQKRREAEELVLQQDRQQVQVNMHVDSQSQGSHSVDPDLPLPEILSEADPFDVSMSASDHGSNHENPSPHMEIDEDDDVDDDEDSAEWLPDSNGSSDPEDEASTDHSSIQDYSDELAELRGSDPIEEDSDQGSLVPEDDDMASMNDEHDTEEDDLEAMENSEEVEELQSEGEAQSPAAQNEVIGEAEYQDHINDILDDLQQEPAAAKPNSTTSASTTYSQDLERVCNERERAEHTLLDLARCRPGTAEAAEYPEWQRKLMTAHKFILQWHSVTLPDENSRIQTVLRVLKKHSDELLKGRRRGDGGGGGDGNPRPKPKDEDEDYVDNLLKNAHLSPAQRILNCMSAQELIDDLEREPQIPLFSQENLPDALIGSAYFGLIKADQASPWLQMRGPIATNLINIWTWHLEFDVEAKIDFVEDVDLAFGEEWSILEILRQVETGEIGSVASRYNCDLYSTRYIRITDRLTRPRPGPNARISTVSAFMTHTEWNFWHFSHDIAQWPVPMYNLPEAIVHELSLEMQGHARVGPRFSDDELADLQRGGRMLSKDEIYNTIIVHTQHALNKFDKKIAQVHEKHKRKSRRRAFGGILPNDLLAPPPNLEVESIIPPLETARAAGTTRVKTIMLHPIALHYGKYMCLRCRRRPKETRKGLKRGCYVIEGTGCLPCLWRKFATHRKNISSKDWWKNKPNRNLKISIDHLEQLVAEAHFNGDPASDNAAPEEWEDTDDEEWLDVAQIERGEKQERKEKEEERKKKRLEMEKRRDEARARAADGQDEVMEG